MQITSDMSEARQVVQSKLDDLAENKRPVLNAMGQKLVPLCQSYFDNLSRGGRGFRGRSWLAPSASTVRHRQALAKQGKLSGGPSVQGIVTGAMQRSLTADVVGDSVSVRYEAPQAFWFNVHRRLIPSRLPNSWREQLTAIVINQFGLDKE